MTRLRNIYSSSTRVSRKVAISVLPEESFLELCEKLTIKAYKELLRNKSYKPEWEEDTFSANLKVIIEDICFTEDIPISVSYQDPQLSAEILEGNKTPKTAKRMDLVFSIFPNPNRLKYGLEAKILTSVNISRRNAKFLCSEYIVSGMDRFIQGDYAIRGCLLGYVIAGSIEDVLKLINDTLCGNGRDEEILKEKHTIDTLDHCYFSYHQKCTLKHLLFQFVAFSLD